MSIVLSLQMDGRISVELTSHRSIARLDNSIRKIKTVLLAHSEPPFFC